MDTVTNDLRNDILSGVFEPGDRLLETPLSEHYQCGRAAIRAALIALVAEGLVEHEANRGATVRRISVHEAIQITEARLALESLIAAQAARHATADDRAELEQVIEDMRAAVTSDDGQRYSELNRILHRRLREVSGHDIAAELVANLRNRAAHHQYRLAVMPGRSAISLEQHANIVAAVVAGDERGAADAMAAHLGSVIDVLQSWGDARATLAGGINR